jgi:hypothetical protein
MGLLSQDVVMHPSITLANREREKTEADEGRRLPARKRKRNKRENGEKVEPASEGY